MHNTVMDKYEIRRQKLRELIDDKYDGVVASLARESGIDPSYLSRMLYPEGKAGKKRIGEDMVEKITKIHPGCFGEYADVSMSTALYSKNEEQSQCIAGIEIPISQIKIPLLANRASMGLGLDQLDTDMVIGALTVQKSWVSKNLPNISRPENLRFIHGYGDSMKPTFADGDVLLVDTGTRAAEVDGVYVLEVHEQLYIKRVSRRFDGRHEISSDNPSVKTVEVLNGDHSVEIKGRVVWAWKGERL